MRRAIAILAAALLCVDAAIAIGLSLTVDPVARQAKEPTQPSSVAPPAPKADPWSPVPAADLGARFGAVYRDIRDRVPSSSPVQISHRKLGDDFEIAIELVTIPGREGQGFPPRVYCLTCPRDRCRYQLDTYRALELIAAAVPRDGLSALSTALGRADDGPRLELIFSGGASGGKVFKWREERYCDFGFVAVDLRDPPAYDVYQDPVCGVGECTVASTGENVQIEANMDIDSNAKLACLRAACLRAASTVASDVHELEISLNADLAIDDGGSRRGAAIAVRLRGLATDAHQDYYEEFMRSFVAAARGS